jgi:putative endonuclease
MADPRKALGRWGEDLAVKHLEEGGYQIIKRNYRCTSGEMDIVAWKDDQWVFVEVKTRRGNRFGRPEDAKNQAKADRLVRVSETYLSDESICDANWRIDLVAVELDNRGRLTRVEQLENAVTGW